MKPIVSFTVLPQTPVLLLVDGLAGSGKSTFMRQALELTGAGSSLFAKFSTRQIRRNEKVQEAILDTHCVQPAEFDQLRPDLVHTASHGAKHGLRLADLRDCLSSHSLVVLTANAFFIRALRQEFAGVARIVTVWIETSLSQITDRLRCHLQRCPEEAASRLARAQRPYRADPTLHDHIVPNNGGSKELRKHTHALLRQITCPITMP